MRTKLQPWHLVAVLVVLCGGVLGILAWWRWRAVATPSAMLACLPRSGSVSVYLDVAALRRAGIMDLVTGSKATEDLEYQQFVDGTGFDYRRDLDALAGAFTRRESRLVLRGTFDWKRLNAYTASQGGKCNNTVCRIAVSDQRYISYYPLRANTMAIAISSNDWAAMEIAPHQAVGGVPTPNQPVWISVSGAALRDVSGLPAGARSFVSPLESAENILLSIGSSDNSLKLNLDVRCASEPQASELVTRLEGATDMLRKLLAREKMRPNPRDLSGVLVGGNFRREGSRVTGGWPIQREFISAIASGSFD
jgi:hypothetical protein